MRNDERECEASCIHAGVQTGSGEADDKRPSQAKSVTAKVLGIPTATLDNGLRLSAQGKLTGAGTKPVSVEQMALARLRAELARVKMEREI